MFSSLRSRIVLGLPKPLLRFRFGWRRRRPACGRCCVSPYSPHGDFEFRPVNNRSGVPPSVAAEFEDSAGRDPCCVRVIKKCLTVQSLKNAISVHVHVASFGEIRPSA